MKCEHQTWMYSVKSGVPGNQAGSWEIRECVDHGDHQGNGHNTSIYYVQFWAEIHLESEKDDLETALE